MQQKGYNSIVSPDRESKGQFGVVLENSFVLSDDGRYVIALDASDTKRILVEDLASGSTFGFGENEGAIATLCFDKDSRTLLAGDFQECLVEYDLDLRKGQGQMIKKHGYLGMGWVFSSFASMGLVFFGGNRNKVRVYDLSSKRMLPVLIDTAIGSIFSLQVCVVAESRVYLGVVGSTTNYSSAKSDLYDFTGLLGKAFIPSEVANDHHRLSCTDTDRVKTQALHIEKLEKRVSGSYTNNQGKRLNKALSTQVKTISGKCQGQTAANRELYTQYNKLKEKLEKVELKNLSRRLPQTNLLLGRALLGNGGLPEQSHDSDDSSEDEMDISQENAELVETVSRQEEQIERLFKEVADLKALRSDIKVLKFDMKRLKKRVGKRRKFW